MTIFVSSIIVAAQLLYATGMTAEKKRNQNVSFNCTADGIPMPTIVWRKNGQLIISNNKRNVTQLSNSTGFRSNTIPGVVQVTSVLTITDLTGSDNGSYSCRADNEAKIGAVLTTPYQLTVVERKFVINAKALSIIYYW